MSVEITHLPNGETITDEATNLAIRGFCVGALALSVPEFLSRDRAADLVVEWFPADKLALAALYRQIADNQPLRVA